MFRAFYVGKELIIVIIFQQICASRKEGIYINMKKFITIILSLILVLAMAGSVFAVNTTIFVKSI